MSTADEEPTVEYLRVHLIRRTPQEQVEYLILQVALLTGKVTTLERCNERLQHRVASLERAIPWTGPPKQKPPKLPPKRPTR